MNNRTLSVSLCLTLATTCHITSAALVALVPGNTSTSLGTGSFSAQTQLDSVTIGATTYNQVTFGSPLMVTTLPNSDLEPLSGENNAVFVMYVSASLPYTSSGSGDDVTNAANAIAAQTDQFITTGQANLLQDDAGGSGNVRPVNFDFGTTFSNTADVYITAFEFGTSSAYDDVTLQLLNTSGATVGSTVTVSGSNWGNVLTTAEDYRTADDNINLTGGFTVGGAAIALGDFGYTGSISGVQMSGVGGADIAGIGFVAVPEPSTYAILAGMLAMACVMLRRRRA